ncbi:MFS transporter [Pseudonocardia humida]|uniref:MFS transporter n=1 Tax=Pseudonocardia humida TaxID=2800819 RepID=A0ABT1A2V2_9PSEU|nr:MFS transporter [Pseudonocardia humida]MCO1657339.1 MFS transporter [Pseudonocardia humida]
MRLSSSARSRWAIALLMLFVAINFADKAIIGLAAAPMMAELGISTTQYGLLSSSFYLLFSISAIAFGFLGNRVPGKWLLIGLAVTWSVAQLPIAVPAAGFGVLLATRILLGAGEGPGVPLGMHVAFTWVEEHKRAFTAALLTVGSGLGVIIGAPLLNMLIASSGWRSPFLLLGVIGLIWALAWYLIGGDGPHSVTAAKATDGTGPADEPRIPYRRLLTTGTWLGTLFSGFTVYWGLALGISFLPLYLGEIVGYERSAIGVMASLPAYVSIVFMLLGGAVSQRLLRRGVSRRIGQGVIGGAFALVAGLSMILMTRAGASAWALPLIALAFGIGNSQTPLSQAAVADTVPARQRGAALGVWYAVVSIASIVSPTLTGAIVDAAATPAAGYGLAFDIAGGLMVLGGLTAMVVVRPDQDAARLGLRGPTTIAAPDGTDGSKQLTPS